MNPRSRDARTRKTTLLVAGLSAVLLVTGLSATAADDVLSLTLTTSKGTAVLIHDADIDLNDMLLSLSVGDLTPSFKYRQKLVLRSAEGAYLAIPPGLFTEARLVQGHHVVTLSNGHQLEGDLVGEVKERAKEGQKSTSYPLASARDITITNVPSWERAEEERFRTLVIKPEWLREVALGEREYKVIASALTCRHDSPRFVRVGEQDWPRSNSFHLATGEATEAVSLENYSELSFDRRPEGVWARITYEGGEQRSGVFLMQAPGEPKPTSNWLLVANLADDTGILIAIRGTSFTFRHVNMK